MADKIVKYKLIPFGNGLVTPTDIKSGGEIWEQNSDVKEMILVGKIDSTLVADPNNFPKGIVEVITQTKLTQRRNKLKAGALDSKKAELYKRDTEALLFEGIRERELGKPAKWNKYLNRCTKIKALTAIPENDFIDYQDDNIPIDGLSVFSKLAIRRAMRVLGIEDKLKILLQNDVFKEDWQDASQIDLNEPLVKTALAQLDVDVDAIKNQIING